MCVISMIDILWQANEIIIKEDNVYNEINQEIENKMNSTFKFQHNSLPLHLFRNTGVNNTICSDDFQRESVYHDDFNCWQQASPLFSFLNYHYLLDNASKIKYLEYEKSIMENNEAVSQTSSNENGLSCNCVRLFKVHMYDRLIFGICV